MDWPSFYVQIHPKFFSVNAFPWVLSSIVNGLVSKRRFDSFFAIQCRDNSEQPIYEQMEGCGDGNLMQLQGNSFGWTEEGIPAVDNIRFSGKKVCEFFGKNSQKFRAP